MLSYRVDARRVNGHGSIALAKQAEIVLDTDTNGRPDAFNPAELFLASIAACMIKSIERVHADPQIRSRPASRSRCQGFRAGFRRRGSSDRLRGDRRHDRGGSTPRTPPPECPEVRHHHQHGGSCDAAERHDPPASS